MLNKFGSWKPNDFCFSISFSRLYFWGFFLVWIFTFVENLEAGSRKFCLWGRGDTESWKLFKKWKLEAGGGNGFVQLLQSCLKSRLGIEAIGSRVECNLNHFDKIQIWHTRIWIWIRIWIIFYPKDSYLCSDSVHPTWMGDSNPKKCSANHKSNIFPHIFFLTNFVFNLIPFFKT